MEVPLTEEARNLGIVTRYSTIGPVRITDTNREIFDLLSRRVQIELIDSIGKIGNLPTDPRIKALRKFYRAIDIDPTRTRPSSESLARRLFRKGIPMINNIVDAGNLASARTLIPIGLYDIDELRGDIIIRTSGQGEIFRGIGSTDDEMKEGLPVISDDRSIIHVYPHRDSMRTRITNDTENVKIIACGVKGIGAEDLEAAILEVKKLARDLSG